ncbi:folylpolyglutamate synthase, mitochondrial-like isoform X2 [Galleria mellonella]|nr:folylpolyglutamate synthase, mitochondrial-like isoform X2 [Galleria mellonella]
MCESILRHHGFRTGFYSSPHLVAVRERVRLDGRVVSEEKFAEHFHRVYDMLDATKAYEGDMPGYFAFLTVMAVNTFLWEKVDVAIIEVGIGGIVDYTNILRKVPVVGITALGIDHTALLGDTLPQIAAAKAGIMKPGCVAYTVSQPPEAMDVLRQVASDTKCPLYVAPDYDAYKFPNGFKDHLQVNIPAYQANASLAIQLANAWMRHKRQINSYLNKKKIKPNSNKTLLIEQNKGVASNGLVLNVPFAAAAGLQDCRWAGRYQTVEAHYAMFHLDGAHTKESMEICSAWFQECVSYDDKVLIFSSTGDRNSDMLLRPLRGINFKRVYFVIPTAYKVTSKNDDNYSLATQSEQLARCHANAKIWKQYNSSSQVTVFECVADALASIKKDNDGLFKSSVLITGSLHLVGAALSILDPSLSTMSTPIISRSDVKLSIGGI